MKIPIYEANAGPKLIPGILPDRAVKEQSLKQFFYFSRRRISGNLSHKYYIGLLRKYIGYQWESRRCDPVRRPHRQEQRGWEDGSRAEREQIDGISRAQCGTSAPRQVGQPASRRFSCTRSGRVNGSTPEALSAFGARASRTLDRHGDGSGAAAMRSETRLH